VTERGARSYVLKYRVNGKQRWSTIGRHGHPMPVEVGARKGAVWTAQSARDEALRLLGRVREGADPAYEKQEARRAETLAEFCDRYAREHIDIHSKASTARASRRRLKAHIKPALGHIRLVNMTRGDVARFHRSLSKTPYEANRCLALVAHMLSTAEKWGVCPGGALICRGVDKFKETARKRYLSSKEASALGVALRAAEAENANIHAVRIIRLLMLTGARRGEIEALRWEEVDFERGALHLADSKTGAKSLPLTAPAKAVLAGVECVEGSPWVFPASRRGGHYQGLGKVWRAIRSAAKLEDVRLHDLRHTFASFGAAGGLSLPLIGELLGHKQAATTQRYAHLSNDPVKQAAEKVSEAVAAAMAGAQADEVVSLTARKRVGVSDVSG
jgi:integrase